jgi:hypothetical protein
LTKRLDRVEDAGLNEIAQTFAVTTCPRCQFDIVRAEL